MNGFDELEELISLGEYRKEKSRLQKLLCLLI